MSGPALYIVRASAQVARGAVTVWVGRRTEVDSQVWRWEVLRPLWQSMGTAETARWVALAYEQSCPAMHEDIGPEALRSAVAQALDLVEPLYHPAG